jgi:hypothetical protein
MKTLVVFALCALVLSCAGGPSYDSSRSVRLKHGTNPSVEGHSLGVMSVNGGVIKLSIQNPDGTERTAELKKGEELTLGDSVYVVVRVEGGGARRLRRQR